MSTITTKCIWSRGGLFEQEMPLLLYRYRHTAGFMRRRRNYGIRNTTGQGANMGYCLLFTEQARTQIYKAVAVLTTSTAYCCATHEKHRNSHSV